GVCRQYLPPPGTSQLQFDAKQVRQAATRKLRDSLIKSCAPLGQRNRAIPCTYIRVRRRLWRLRLWGAVRHGPPRAERSIPGANAGEPQPLVRHVAGSLPVVRAVTE